MESMYAKVRAKNYFAHNGSIRHVHTRSILKLMSTAPQLFLRLRQCASLWCRGVQYQINTIFRRLQPGLAALLQGGSESYSHIFICSVTGAEEIGADSGLCRIVIRTLASLIECRISRLK
jgi:hypothetical protein